MGKKNNKKSKYYIHWRSQIFLFNYIETRSSIISDGDNSGSLSNVSPTAGNPSNPEIKQDIEAGADDNIKVNTSPLNKITNALVQEDLKKKEDESKPPLKVIEE